MIEYKNETVKKEQTTAFFYCDKCHKFLGASVEFEDGYIHSYGEYWLNVYLPLKNKKIEVRQTFCNICMEEFEDRLEQFLNKERADMGVRERGEE